MWPARGLALVAFLAPLVLGATQVDRGSIKGTSEKYAMRKPYGNEGAETTFIGEVEVPQDKADLSMEELYLFASGGFNWLVENEQDRKTFETEYGQCILSALWVPQDHRVYLATKAKGRFHDDMSGAPKKRRQGYNSWRRYLWAPVWSSRAVRSDNNALIKNQKYHAEDTVYFHFERQRHFRSDYLWPPPKNDEGKPTWALTNAANNPQNARDVKYPQGSKVVTWGYYPNSSEDEKNKGLPIEACNPNNQFLGSRQSCQTIADDLGVEWASLQNTPQPQVEANNNMDITEGPSSSQEGCESNPPGEEPPSNAGEDPPAAKRRRYETRQESCLTAPGPIEPVTIDHMPEPAGEGEGDGDGDGSCQDDSQCPPSMCAGGGGGVVTCKDNKCTCVESEPPPDNSCESPDNCQDLDCEDGLERQCIDGECKCKEPEAEQPPAPTPPPEVPECWMQNALPDQYTSAFCRCHIGDETRTLPLLTVENPSVVTESCHYMTLPTGTENPVTEVTVTYTIGCDVCAGPGGVENHDPDWCEPIEGCVPPRPTYALYISDTSVSLGTAFNEDEGVTIGQTLVDKLREACPGDQDTCDTTAFEVADVPLIVDEGVEYMILEANVDDSYYNSTSSRDFMIYGAVSGMVEATRDSCEEVTYKDPADSGESGCEEGPLPEKRHPPPPEVYWDEETGERQLRKRIPPSDPDGTVNDMMCTYSTNMCAGPKIITTILGTQADPYLNNLGIRFELKKKETGFDNAVAQFFCEAIVNALALAAMRYAPKLAGFEGVGQIEDMALEAICGSE